MVNVDIWMLGRFAVAVDGTAVADDGWRRRQAASLVKLLAVAPRRQLHRERVIDAIWPELSVAEAAPRLHKAAFYARKALGAPDGVVLNGDTVTLFPDATVSVDVADFERAAEAASRDGSSAAAAQALELHGGELLPGDLYEPWCEELRERVSALHTALLHQAERWEDLVELDPADEDAHLALMRRYADLGDRRAALRQFERMDRALRRELGVAPRTEAVELRDQLVEEGVDARAAPESAAALVARADERAALLGTLRDASPMGVVFVSGAPGVGKTALVEWLRAQALEQGWRVGSGVAAAIEGAWPYAPALEAITSLVRNDPELLDELPPAFRDAIDRALAAEGEAWSGDSAHQRLLVATAELVRLAARDGGVLLVLDDVHEADDATLRLVHYLGRTLRDERVVLVLAHRDAPSPPELHELRARLVGRRSAIDVRVEPLDETATAELVASLRPDADRALVQQVHEISAGVPLVIVESMRHADVSLDGPSAIGARVVATLAAPTHEVLQRVAVVGSTFDTDEFVALSDLDDDEAYAQLDAALAARVVVPTETGYRFRHDLVRDALLAELPEHRRRAVHRAAAERLEQLGGSAARVAHHLVRSGDPAAAVPYVLQAGETEAAMGAFADALALVEPVVPYARGRHRARLLALRADLLAAVGDPSAVPAYRDALGLARSDEVPLIRARLARAAVQRGDLATAEEAVGGLDPDGGPHDGDILMARGMVAYLSGDLAGADAAADQARERVEEGEPTWQLLDVITLQGLLAHNRGEWFERLRHELLATRQAPELAVSVFDSHLCVAEYLLYGPTPYDEVIRMASDLRASAERSGALRAVAFGSAVIGEAALLSGDLETAERELADAIDAHRELGAHAGEALCLQRLAEVRVAQHDGEAAVALLRQALARARWSIQAPHLIQRIYGTWIRAAEDADAARAVVDQAEATMSDDDECQFCQVMYLLPAAIACADAGDVDDARVRLAAGEQCAARWPGTAWHAAVLEARAHLARAEGDVAGADRLLAEAAAVFEASGQPLDAARCRA